MLTRPTIVDRPLRTRAAVSNGTRMHPKGVDGRSAEARRFKDLVSSFAASLGGEGALTEAERALIRNAASLTVQCERLQAALVAGREVNSEEMTRLANSSARVLAALRIKGERKEATPTLSQYLAAARRDGAPP
jgi:hypothetical protein